MNVGFCYLSKMYLIHVSRTPPLPPPQRQQESFRNASTATLTSHLCRSIRPASLEKCAPQGMHIEGMFCADNYGAPSCIQSIVGDAHIAVCKLSRKKRVSKQVRFFHLQVIIDQRWVLPIAVYRPTCQASACDVGLRLPRSVAFRLSLLSGPQSHAPQRRTYTPRRCHVATSCEAV